MDSTLTPYLDWRLQLFRHFRTSRNSCSLTRRPIVKRNTRELQPPQKRVPSRGKMGDVDISTSPWRLVEVGRVVLFSSGPHVGRLATIVEIIDHKRVSRTLGQIVGFFCCPVMDAVFLLREGLLTSPVKGPRRRSRRLRRSGRASSFRTPRTLISHTHRHPEITARRTPRTCQGGVGEGRRGRAMAGYLVGEESRSEREKETVDGFRKIQGHAVEEAGKLRCYCHLYSPSRTFGSTKLPKLAGAAFAGGGACHRNGKG